MIEMDDDGDITSYTYDRENRLIEAELPDSTTIEYEYGPEGERLKRYDGTDTIYYVYDGEDVLMELDGSGTVEARYTHVPADAVGGGSCESCGGGSGSVWAIDYPLMMRRDSENYFYMKDKLGSVVGLLDDEENVVASYEYDAFGSIVGETSSVWNPYRFTAREWDPDTGLYYYRARTYKPDTGRFMQQDPEGMVDGTNMFVYVGNDPVNNVDPYGKRSVHSTFFALGLKATYNPRLYTKPYQRRAHFWVGCEMARMLFSYNEVYREAKLWESFERWAWGATYDWYDIRATMWGYYLHDYGGTYTVGEWKIAGYSMVWSWSEWRYIFIPKMKYETKKKFSLTCEQITDHFIKLYKNGDYHEEDPVVNGIYTGQYESGLDLSKWP